MAILTERIAVSYPLQSERFAANQVAANFSNQALTLSAGHNMALTTLVTLGITGVPMPFAGSLVGIGVSLSALGSAGTLTAAASVNGTTGNVHTPLGGSQLTAYQTFEYGTQRFNAGDTLGVKISTSAAWGGGTDVYVTLYFSFD